MGVHVVNSTSLSVSRSGIAGPQLENTEQPLCCGSVTWIAADAGSCEQLTLDSLAPFPVVLFVGLLEQTWPLVLTPAPLLCLRVFAAITIGMSGSFFRIPSKAVCARAGDYWGERMHHLLRHASSIAPAKYLP
jgi:hypothetical protein